MEASTATYRALEALGTCLLPAVLRLLQEGKLYAHSALREPSPKHIRQWVGEKVQMNPRCLVKIGVRSL